ncbi:hypothetical protein HJC23_002012 [Cyclotella cryptica]|uniref:Uncharacterized protein n=1 Tax=Cyclotella cryptica TaxID=29204 RepID=A0ABD3NI83_9STRA
MRRRRSSEVLIPPGRNVGGDNVGTGSEGNGVTYAARMDSIIEKSPYDDVNDGAYHDNLGPKMQASRADTMTKQMSGLGQNSFETEEMARYYQCRTTIITVYILHSALTLATLVLGVMHNGGYRKYVPVDPTGLSNLVINELILEEDSVSTQFECLKAYVDVHTSTVKDDLAFVCCTKHDSSPVFTTRPGWKNYQSNLCYPRDPYFDISMQQLPFSKRLTRFPEAWVLPMLPIFIRLVYQLISALGRLMKRGFESRHPVKSPSHQSLRQGSRVSSSSSANSILERVVVTPSAESFTSSPLPDTQTANNAILRVTLQRLLFYFLILNLRGWGLYVGANALEDYLIVPWVTGNRVISPLRTDSVSDVEHNIQSSNNECWYKDVLKTHHRTSMEQDYFSDCYGRPFDFSDHIVLFLAHYLPIFLFEMIYCWMFPFWVSSKSPHIKQQASRGRHITIACAVLHAVLFLYLHLIVLHATYQTAAYFHTTAEVIVGYMISWLLNLPILYLICSEKWVSLRQFVGLPSTQMIRLDQSNQIGTDKSS